MIHQPSFLRRKSRPYWRQIGLRKESGKGVLCKEVALPHNKAKFLFRVLQLRVRFIRKQWIEAYERKAREVHCPETRPAR